MNSPDSQIGQCVILAGGMGTRLGSLTADMPKPMLPIDNRPFLDTLVKEAARRGFRRILFLAGFRADVLHTYVKKLALQGDLEREFGPISFEICVEPEPLGTGGALIHALEKLDDRFLLLNGDTWFDFNWLDLAQAATQTGLSHLSARSVPQADRYETFRTGPDGLIERIVPRGSDEAAAMAQAAGAVPINGGVYALHKADLAGFAGRVSLEDEILPALVSRGRLAARQYDGFFIDIGIPETYAAGQTSIPARQRRGALFLDRDGVLNADDNYVHRPEQVRWIDGAAQAVKLANDMGLYVFVVTNQAGVARGYYDEDMVKTLHRWMAEALRAQGASIDAWRYCPYHVDGTVPAYARPHPWRKPAPGMLTDLMAHWPVDPQASLMIGDKTLDMEAAQAAGVTGALFAGGNLHDFAAPLLQARTQAQADAEVDAGAATPAAPARPREDSPLAG